MARDWSKRNALLIEDDVAPAVPKADLRAEADRLMAAYSGTVRKLPMVAALRCRSCGHRGTARVAAGVEPKFKCSACGSSLVAWRL